MSLKTKVAALFWVLGCLSGANANAGESDQAAMTLIFGGEETIFFENNRSAESHYEPCINDENKMCRWSRTIDKLSECQYKITIEDYSPGPQIEIFDFAKAVGYEFKRRNDNPSIVESYTISGAAGFYCNPREAACSKTYKHFSSTSDAELIDPRKIRDQFDLIKTKYCPTPEK